MTAPARPLVDPDVITAVAEAVSRPSASEILTAEEAAILLRVEVRTVYHLIKSGKLVARNVGTGKRPVWRILRTRVHAWLDAPTDDGMSVASPTNTSGNNDGDSGGGAISPRKDARPSTSPRPTRPKPKSASGTGSPGSRLREKLGLRPKS